MFPRFYLLLNLGTLDWIQCFICQHIWYGLNLDISYDSNCLLVLPSWLLIIIKSFVWVLLLPNSSHKKLSVIHLRTVYNSHPIPRIMSCCLQPWPVRIIHLFLVLYLHLRYGFTFSLSYSFYLMYVLLSNCVWNIFLIYFLLICHIHLSLYMHRVFCIYCW